MDGAEVGVFEKTNDVGLSCFLEGLEGLRLEAESVVHVHRDATDEALEGSTWQQHVH